MGASIKNYSNVEYPELRISYSGKNQRIRPVIVIKKPMARKPIIEEKNELISLKNIAFIIY